MDEHKAYAKIIHIAAQLARGSMLPDYTGAKYVSANAARRGVERAADALREMAVNLRDAADCFFLSEARAIAEQQAEDDGLWFVARTAPEAYLQAALRKLHAAVEGEKEPSRD